MACDEVIGVVIGGAGATLELTERMGALFLERDRSQRPRD